MAKVTRYGGASNKDAAVSVVTHPKRIQESEEVQTSEQFQTEEVEDNYDEWTATQLRDELADRELPTSGKKAELVERLREDDAESDEDGESETDELEPTS